MKIVVAVRCYNESKNVERLIKGYGFADEILVSDGGSSDDSLEKLGKYPKVKIIHFSQYEEKNGLRWNPDNPHINFLLDEAKRSDPDWIIYDDFDDVPNYLLRENARDILEKCDKPQVNAFRLYMWGNAQYFPYMNRDFDPAYRSLWAWKPREINIRADENARHGTIAGITNNFLPIELPMCLLHKSWHPDTVNEKIEKYRMFGIDMGHPLKENGSPVELPEWAREE